MAVKKRKNMSILSLSRY